MIQNLIINYFSIMRLKWFKISIGKRYFLMVATKYNYNSKKDNHNHNQGDKKG